MAEIIRSVTNTFFIGSFSFGNTEAYLLFYGNIQDSDNYFSKKLNGEKWINTIRLKKEQALSQATRLIDRLNFAGNKKDSTQNLQFPRGDDTTVPTDIKIACYELSYRLLIGKIDIEMEIANLTAESRGYSGVRSTYNRTFVQEWIMAGIPSAIAWSYLRPYLVNPDQMLLSRVN